MTKQFIAMVFLLAGFCGPAWAFQKFEEYRIPGNEIRAVRVTPPADEDPATIVIELDAEVQDDRQIVLESDNGLDDCKATVESAIGDEGAALYLGAQLWLDMIFPPLLGAVLFLCYRWLFPGLPGLIIGTVSLTYVAADYLENMALAAMLRAGADGLTPEMAATANQWTITKWSLALVGLVTLIIGIALRLRRRWFAA